MQFHGAGSVDRKRLKWTTRAEKIAAFVNCLCVEPRGVPNFFIRCDACRGVSVCGLSIVDVVLRDRVGCAIMETAEMLADISGVPGTANRGRARRSNDYRVLCPIPRSAASANGHERGTSKA